MRTAQRGFERSRAAVAIRHRSRSGRDGRIAAERGVGARTAMTALMYHDVVPAGGEDTSGFAGRDAALYKVTPELFDAHLRAIQQSLPDLRNSRDLIFTFDDGGVSALGVADALER